MAEVYEVAAFYHHLTWWEATRRRQQSPSRLRIHRLRDGRLGELLAALPIVLAARFASCRRLVSAGAKPQIMIVGQNQFHANAESGCAGAGERRKHPQRDHSTPHPHLDIVAPGHMDYAAYRETGGYRLSSCVGGERGRDDVIAAMENRACAARWRHFPASRK
jgi:hypothetical protein